MKAKVKVALKEAFLAPQPVKKEEFLKRAEQPVISSFSFMLMQLSYIRKRVWIMSLVLFSLAMASVGYVGRDCIWSVSAMVPFIALYGVTENTRSITYGMAELEMASRFSLRSVVLARLSAIGSLHFTLLFFLTPLVGQQVLLPFFRVGTYLLVPYSLTSLLGLMAVRRTSRKEGSYICMGISIIISILPAVLKEAVPALYEEKSFIWWAIALFYLVAKIWSEYKRTIEEGESFVWN